MVQPNSDPNANVIRLNPDTDDAGLVVRPIGDGFSGGLLQELYVISGAMAYRLDVVSPTTSYEGWAAPGSMDSDDVWRIRKVFEPAGASVTWATITGTWVSQTATWADLGAGSGDIVVTWADGTREFDNIWDDHLSLTYT